MVSFSLFLLISASNSTCREEKKEEKNLKTQNGISVISQTSLALLQNFVSWNRRLHFVSSPSFVVVVASLRTSYDSCLFLFFFRFNLKIPWRSCQSSFVGMNYFHGNLDWITLWVLFEQVTHQQSISWVRGVPPFHLVSSRLPIATNADFAEPLVVTSWKFEKRRL